MGPLWARTCSERLGDGAANQRIELRCVLFLQSYGPPWDLSTFI